MSWVVFPKRRAQARFRLFCFPYAGSGASTFRSWTDHLPPVIELCTVQLPGRENRLMEPAFTQLAKLLPRLAPSLSPYLDIPFAFFGHSMGALISFELARFMRKGGAANLKHLFVSGHRAPQLPDKGTKLHKLSDTELLNTVRRLNGTPEEVLQNRDLMQLLLPMLRADFTLCETYVYSPDEPFGFSISAFGGMSDPAVSRDDLDAWRDQTARSFKLRMFPGDHFFLHDCYKQMLQAVYEDMMAG